MTRIYLDYNATAPVRPEVIAGVSAAMHVTGNPSSVHGDGRAARKLVEDARAHVAALAGVRSAQVIFNSGATEGNNTILSGHQGAIVFIGGTEHPSVMEAAPKADRLPMLSNGLIDLEKLKTILAAAPPPSLIALQLVNSETGVIQPVADVAAIAHEFGAKFLCDAVQAAGRIDIDFKSLDCDYMTLSAHKFGGPQGVGALIFREGLQMPKFMRGGGQEKRQRAGTENVAGIAGFGIAAKLAVEGRADYAARTRQWQIKLEKGLKTIANDLVIAGENAPRVPNTTNVLLPGASAETQLMSMDLEGIAVSSGSACSSGTFKPSHVLAAMGFDEAASKSALRFSTGWATTDADIDNALAAYAKIAARIRK
jgi:cysteine desulfurase